MVLKILLGIAVVIVLLVIFIATRRSGFRIERSITIAAPPEVPFALVNDFHAWRRLVSLEKIDPQLQRTYEGPSSGAGSVYSWVGNKKVGEGRMTILKSDAPSLISIKLQFIKPFAATNTATFTFAPASGGTKVTWGMDGCHSFMGKAFSLVMNMDKMIGGDFERGLAVMKQLSENRSAANAVT